MSDAAGGCARATARNRAAKRMLAQREFALGAESLARFTQREPLWRVRQACARRSAACSPWRVSR